MNSRESELKQGIARTFWDFAKESQNGLTSQWRHRPIFIQRCVRIRTQTDESSPIVILAGRLKHCPSLIAGKLIISQSTLMRRKSSIRNVFSRTPTRLLFYSFFRISSINNCLSPIMTKILSLIFS